MNTPETSVCLVLCTVAREQSEEITRRLVNCRLAACINLFPVRSSYIWEGQFCSDSEDLMIIKTTKSKSEELKGEILRMHSYDLPEIITVPVTGGHMQYLDWVIKKVG